MGEMSLNTFVVGEEPSKITPRYLVVRHGPKEYDNNKSPDGTYPLDPALTDEGRELAYQHFVQLLQSFEPPVRIVTSPFLRARETAQELRRAIFDITGLSVSIYREPLMGEFLGHQVQHRRIKKGDFRPETGHVVIDKTISEMEHLRVPQLRKKVVLYPKNTWMVSHGVVIKYWHDVRYPEFLHGSWVDQDNKIHEL